jgi:hypothetical protein
MAWVWEHSRSVGADRLVLLAIADHANDSGSDAFPSLARIATRSKVDKRTAQRSIRALVALGELEVRDNAGPYGAHRYRVLMAAGRQDTTGGGDTPPGVVTDRPGETPPGRETTGGGISSRRGWRDATRNVLEPSTTPQPPASGGRIRKRANCPKHVRHNTKCTDCARLQERTERQASWPPWCGNCNEHTRKLADELKTRCPDCHPLKAVSA